MSKELVWWSLISAGDIPWLLFCPFVVFIDHEASDSEITGHSSGACAGGRNLSWPMIDWSITADAPLATKRNSIPSSFFFLFFKIRFIVLRGEASCWTLHSGTLLLWPQCQFRPYLPDRHRHSRKAHPRWSLPMRIQQGNAVHPALLSPHSLTYPQVAFKG
jgi:hypothetical protein